jgi:branched-subunit amino acid ABC-type transport system permease component
VRGAPDFTLLLTSFGVHFVVEAFFLMYVSASVKNFARPGWIARHVDSIGIARVEVIDIVVIVVTLVVLVASRSLLLQDDVRLALRAAAATSTPPA